MTYEDYYTEDVRQIIQISLKLVLIAILFSENILFFVHVKFCIKCFFMINNMVILIKSELFPLYCNSLKNIATTPNLIIKIK